MKERDKPRERAILPQDLLSDYVEARTNTYPWLSSSDAVPDLSIPGSKGFKHPPRVFEEAGYLRPYKYMDEWVSGKEKGAFAGREIFFSRYDVNDLVIWYSYMGGLTEEGLKRGEDFVYGLLLRGFLRIHADQVRLGNNVQFKHQIEQGSTVYEGKGINAGRSWHDRETIELNGTLLYIGHGDGTYNPGARGRAIAKHAEVNL